jgi:homoserine dehydrogenase
VKISLVLIGFGSVGRALARLLLRKQPVLADQYGIECITTSIATSRHGKAIAPAGIDLEKALELVERGVLLDALSTQPAPPDPLEFIRACPGDVLFENIPTNHHTGQPALDYLRTALERGMHAITANKGPVVHGYRELTELAARQAKRFLFESSVMDGAPIFSLFRGALPAIELRGFSGILNSTTNLILDRMAEGETLDEAVRYAQSIGIAETDPSADVDGWDAAIKVAAIATVLMGTPLKPGEVERTGIRAITPTEIASARTANERWKLVCSARRAKDEYGRDHVVGRVAPQRVGADSPLFSIRGTSSYIQFESDVLPGLGIVEGSPTPETTAYGLLADLINAIRGS